MPKSAAILGLFLTLTGCASPQPWVKPYQRGYLADPIMSFEKDPVSSRYMGHVYEAREAGRGADGSSGGGCGCN
ncbi:MAG TPA: DUF4266 domain-containing protein [Marinagarivorans sp.]